MRIKMKNGKGECNKQLFSNQDIGFHKKLFQLVWENTQQRWIPKSQNLLYNSGETLHNSELNRQRSKYFQQLFCVLYCNKTFTFRFFKS